MKNELTYIDKIVKQGVDGAKIKPSTSWEQFNTKFNGSHGGAGSAPAHKISSFITSKLFIASTVIISVVVGIFIFSNINTNNAEKVNPKSLQKATDTTVIKLNKPPVENKKKAVENEKLNGISDKSKKATDNDKKDNKDVTIKVVVPVHKVVIKRKNIYIKKTDSLKNNKDTIK